MKDIIAHRGFWLDASEQNSKLAFTRALSNGFGIETDLRDCNGEIVISHDMATSDCMSFEAFLELCSSSQDVALALNVKADGLQSSLVRTQIPNRHFYFDMSVPDMLGYLNHSLPLFTRFSDIENSPALYQNCSGVWLDNFKDDTLELSVLEKFLADGKSVVLVSPELHKRCEQGYWETVKKFLTKNPQYKDMLGICTDYPQKARNYFNG